MVERKFPLAAMAALLFVVLISPAYSQTSTQRKQSGASSMMMNPSMKLAEANFVEIEMGKMASEKATNPRVKEFAEMMVRDHTDGLNKIQSALGVTSADVKMNARYQQTYDRLSKLSGAQFDREYMSVMVADHQADVRFLEDLTGHGRPAGKTGPGATHRQKSGARGAMGDMTDISGIAQDLLPTVKHHLQMAAEIQKELQKPYRK